MNKENVCKINHFKLFEQENIPQLSRAERTKQMHRGKN